MCHGDKILQEYKRWGSLQRLKRKECLLAEMGYQVHLIDPIAIHIQQAKETAKNREFNLRATLWEMQDNSIKKIVLLTLFCTWTTLSPNQRGRPWQGPTRSLSGVEDWGALFAAGITRFASFRKNSQ